MIDINTDRMKEYELATHDSYVNCIDNDEIKEFYERYINWLENKLETLVQQSLSGSEQSSSPKSRLQSLCDDCCNSCRSDVIMTECEQYEQS